MKEIIIIIPTRNRWDKLMQCLGSIPWEPWIKVILGCDGDGETFEKICRTPYYDRLFKTTYVRDQIGSMRLCNLMTHWADDGLIPLCDDMEILPGTLERAIEKFNQEFPDDDGVLGFHQEGISSYAPTGVCLVGQKFLARYPGKQLFNPAYAHFGDVEIYELAHKLDKFKFGGKDVAVYHRHEADQTHQEGRRGKKHDEILRQERREAGQIWGLN